MITTIKHAVLAALALAATNACKQMIDVDDPINQISTVKVFEDKSTAYAALDQLYTELQTNSLYSGGSAGAGVLLGSYTDDLELSTSASGTPRSDVYLNQVLAENAVVKSVWANAYKEIYIANALIEGVANSSLDAVDKKQIEGEATVIRSMVYLNVMQIYGDIPYTRTTDYTVNQKLPKSSETEILQFLETDLTRVIQDLPDEYRSSDRIYVNKKVGQLLLSNIYLIQKRWFQAEQLAQEIISDTDYSFENDITQMFKKAGKHIVFQLKTLYDGAPVPETGMYYFSTVPPQNYVLSPSLVASFADSDLRKTAWITKVTGNGEVFFRNDKYRNIDMNNDESSVVFRLENLYFILAEALANQNKINEAIIYINKIRQRAGIALLDENITKEALLTEISEEKRREFFGEQGQRFFDLKRMGKLGLLKQHKANWQDYHQRWPLPATEILLNPNLSPQNPNY